MNARRIFSFSCFAGALGALICAAPAALAQSPTDPAPAIILSAATHNFVAVPAGTTVKYGIHVTNRTGASFVFGLQLDGPSSFAQVNNCPANITAGAACEIIFTYTAPADSKWENATVTLPTAGLPLLMGDGKPVPTGNIFYLKAHSVPAGVVSLNSSKHDFLAVPVGSSAPDNFGLLVSNGTAAAIPFSYNATGDTAAYKVESNCPATIAPSGQCSLNFNFKPTAKGWQQLQVDLNTGSAPVQGGNKVTLVGKGS